jgi:lipoprotein signal peptidase
MQRKISIAGGIALLVLFDQVSKIFVLKFFSSSASLNSYGVFGTKFGFLDYRLIAFLGLVLAIVFYFSQKNRIYLNPIILIVAGGLSNLIDRFTRGGVVDFIDLKFWPSFNFADAMVTIGAIWLVYLLVFRPKFRT